MLSGAVHKMTIPFCNNCGSSKIVFIRLWNKNKKAFRSIWNGIALKWLISDKKPSLFFCKDFLLLMGSLVTQRRTGGNGLKLQ